jgi:hypothetical protein
MWIQLQTGNSKNINQSFNHGNTVCVALDSSIALRDLTILLLRMKHFCPADEYAVRYEKNSSARVQHAVWSFSTVRQCISLS